MRKKVDQKNSQYDAIIVGSGATGGLAAKCLTEGGANVLLLEAGSELAAEARGEREKSREEFDVIKARQPIQSQGLLYNKRNCHLFVDDLENPYSTDSATKFNWIRSRQAGGRTLVWSRFALRMSEEEFARPNGGDNAPWPVSYRDLAPYYDQVEALIGVSGTSEGISSLPDGRFLPRRVSSYFRTLQEKLAHRFPKRHLIPSREASGNDIRPNTSPILASTVGALYRRCNRQKLTLRTNCIAARIELDRANHAKSVVFVDRENHRWYEVSGRVIVLCASTIESTRLLLASKSRDFPTGLANTSGVLGRYLMDHFGGPRLVAMAKIPGAEPFCRERAYIPRFCNLAGEHEDFAQGYGIQAHFETDAQGNIILTMGVFGEVLPYADNSVELDETTLDAVGIPIPRICFQYRENEHRMALHAQVTLQEIVDALGFRPMVVHNALLVPGTRSHELGGARMGTSPDNSVLNAFNQCWDVTNLFVTDGSSFPYAGCKGPTLTMMALTARACNRILERLHDGTV